ncbi:DegV family protein [Streptococcus caprae]|uniref:DegV family protein n=1 Tax=Streptococcus caprae TaxID=1640501 RepID=A0ABV8CUX4_9STRE
MKFKILTDSTSDIDQTWAQEQAVDVLGLTVQLEGVTYETVGPDRLTSTVLLEKMNHGAKPQTSQINVGTFEAYFRQVVEAGQAVFYVAFSSTLSGTYQSAVMAREVVLDDFPQAEIVIYDTKAASLGQTYLVMKAVEVREAGGSLADALAVVEDLAPRMRTIFLVDDLNHLMRGGRISKTSAIIGGLVNIKPIITIARDGSLQSTAKARGSKKAVSTAIDMILDGLADDTVLVAYADQEEPAQVIAERLRENPQITRVLVGPLGPVISAHVGPGTIGVFAVGKEER